MTTYLLHCQQAHHCMLLHAPAPIVSANSLAYGSNFIVSAMACKLLPSFLRLAHGWSLGGR